MRKKKKKDEKKPCYRVLAPKSDVTAGIVTTHPLLISQCLVRALCQASGLSTYKDVTAFPLFTSSALLSFPTAAAINDLTVNERGRKQASEGM